MKKIYKSFLLILSFLSFQTATIVAQTPVWSWAKSFGDSMADVISAISTDDSANVYATGYFSETINLDQGAGTIVLNSAGDGDIIISKQDKFGNYSWAKSIGGKGFDWGSGIATDNDGNIYVTGFFSDTVDFDPGPNITWLEAEGANDIFVCKLNSSGDFMWAKRMGGTGSEAGKAIAVDDSGNVFITGAFDTNGDYDPDTSTYTLPIFGQLDIFVEKLDKDGNFIWAKAIGDWLDDQPYHLTIDDESNVYITGYFEDQVDFDPGPAVFNLYGSGFQPDAFICKLNTSGDFVWAIAISGNSSNEAYGIAVDAKHNVYSTGDLIGTVDFDPDPTSDYFITSAGNFDGYIAKYDSLGHFIWAKSIGGTDDDQCFAIDLDNSANVYTAGIFRSTADFNPDPFITNNLTATSGSFDAFILKLDSSGTFQWVSPIGGDSREQATCIVTTDEQNLFTGGYFYSTTASFDSIVVTNTVANFSAEDAFIARLGNQPTTISENNIPYLTLFPNPSTQIINCIFSNDFNENIEIIITDISGKIIKTISAKRNVQCQIDLSNLNSGIYFAKFKSDKFETTRKLILNR